MRTIAGKNTVIIDKPIYIAPSELRMDNKNMFDLSFALLPRVSRQI